MTTVVVIVLLLVSLVGHGILWLGLINRLHATALARRPMRAVTGLFYCFLLGIPLLFFGVWFQGGEPFIDGLHRLPEAGAPYAVDVWQLYLIVAIVVAVLRGPVWAIDRARHRPPAVVVEHRIESVDLAAVLGRYPVAGGRARLFSRVPGNQMFRLDVDVEEVEMERLPPALAGLSILHLSDFHFSLRITRDYFDEVVRIANRLQPDLLAVTGDICDAAARIDWIGPIFGELVAPLGKYFVLGNHDIRLKKDVTRLRAALSAAGCVDLAAGPRSLEVRGQSVLLAGNERPWFPLAESTSAALTGDGPKAFKILLAHSPDQFPWARRHDFDLMLAGHTHGGQICFPGIGPVVCPSRHGIRYASGTFVTGPTLMHVSRGVSSLFPLRLLCPPEMTKLVLHPAAARPL
ncbi:MAG TPA: metallophosphoesterase [Pirellulales bacterium]|nr:metallophosphoesterase [Pirellulales bacterium]